MDEAAADVNPAAVSLPWRAAWSYAGGVKPAAKIRVTQSGAAPYHFTAMILMEPKGSGTRYRAIVCHGVADAAKQHADRGFHDGWGKALDQLVAHMKTVA